MHVSVFISHVVSGMNHVSDFISHSVFGMDHVSDFISHNVSGMNHVSVSSLTMFLLWIMSVISSLTMFLAWIMSVISSVTVFLVCFSGMDHVRRCFHLLWCFYHGKLACCLEILLVVSASLLIVDITSFGSDEEVNPFLASLPNMAEYGKHTES